MIVSDSFVIEQDAILRPFTIEMADYCDPFQCDDKDLDDFFQHDAFLYEKELLGRTYAWLYRPEPTKILALVTLANDSIKAKDIISSARNRVQRSITNAKRGMNYPAVLIGRLGVSRDFRERGWNVGSQVISFLKDWFRIENKTGCRFFVVDAYNNPRTLHFYERNGFKTLYKSEEEERDFLRLRDDEPLETRFMFFDLKK